LTNPANYYNKLNITLNTGGNPTDAKFAIAISPDAFASTTYYIQADDTLGSSPVWQTNTVWGASGFTIVGLLPGTTYSVKVSAIQGNFSQSPYGPTAALATSNSTFSYSLSPNSVNIGQLVPGTIVTSGTTVTANVSTNGTGGAIIYVYDSNSGLLSNSTSYTINSGSQDLSVVSEGYGITGTGVSQSTGGPMEILSPYNGGSTVVGGVSASKAILFDSSNQPVSSGQGTFVLKAKAGMTAKAATDYADLITVIASATF